MALTEARKEYLARWREKHRARLREYHTEWRQANPEKVQASTRRDYERHREARLAKSSAWAKRNPEKAREKVLRYLRTEKGREKARRWQEANPERMKEKAYRYRHAGHGKSQARVRNYRAAKAGNPGFATPDQVAARVAYWGDKCWMCGGAWDSIDHVIPVSRGGANWPSNLRPICRPCNAAKGNRLVAPSERGISLGLIRDGRRDQGSVKSEGLSSETATKYRLKTGEPRTGNRVGKSGGNGHEPVSRRDPVTTKAASAA